MLNNLYEMRKSADLTLQQLAEMTGTTNAHIHNIENGKSDPGIKIAYAISRELGVTVYEMFPG